MVRGLRAQIAGRICPVLVGYFVTSLLALGVAINKASASFFRQSFLFGN
jgi:hypothetical protein